MVAVSHYPFADHLTLLCFMKKGVVVEHPNQSFERFFFVITNKQKIENTFYDLLLLLSKNCISFLQVFALSPKNAI